MPTRQPIFAWICAPKTPISMAKISTTTTIPVFCHVALLVSLLILSPEDVWPNATLPKDCMAIKVTGGATRDAPLVLATL